MSYQDIYDQSMADPDGFWAEAAAKLHWDQPWQQVLDRTNPPFYRWFAGGQLNTCYNAVDRHVESGRGAQAAIIYDSPVTDSKETISYRQLQERVARFAGALVELGVQTGDRVIIYMPMVPEALVAMLGCARIGAIHSVVFGGFSARELATRIDDAKPRVIVAGSCGIEPSRIVHYKPLLDAAIDQAAHKPEHCLILQRPQEPGTLIEGRDVEWHAIVDRAEPAACVPVESSHPLYILYTSGTTGQPKGVVRDTGGHAVAMQWSMANVYGVKPGEVFWAASDVGWVVGHSYICYGPLLHGCTTILYEGKPVGTPDPGAFWRVIAEHGVDVMFTAPTAFRAIKREDPEAAYLAKYDLKHFRTLFLAGERCDPPTLQWAVEKLQVPVIDHWWQTETGWAIAANCLGLEQLPVKPGSPARAVPGYDVRVLGDDNQLLPAGAIGRIMIKLPLPPSCLLTLWGNDQRYISAYLSAASGYYLTGDAGYQDEDGYLWIMSRIDDIINVSGHRLSTGAMEEVLAAHPDVAECAVIGVTDDLKGEVPLGLVVLKAGLARDSKEIEQELIALVRERIGPVACFHRALVVKRLPKTRSGKILRGVMRKIADHQAYTMPATIDDPAILNEITVAFAATGKPH